MQNRTERSPPCQSQTWRTSLSDDMSSVYSEECMEDSAVAVAEMMKANLLKHLGDNSFSIRFPQMRCTSPMQIIIDPGYLVFQDSDIYAHIKLTSCSKKPSSVRFKVDMVTIVGKRAPEVYCYHSQVAKGLKYMQGDNIWQCHNEVKTLADLPPHTVQSEKLASESGKDEPHLTIIKCVKELYHHIKSIEKQQSLIIEKADDMDVFLAGRLRGEQWAKKLVGDVASKRNSIRSAPPKRRTMIVDSESEDEDEHKCPKKRAS